MGRKKLGDSLESFARRRQYTLAFVVAIFTIGSMVGGGVTALIERREDSREGPPDGASIGEPPLPDAPIFVITASRVDPWAPWDEGNHVVCTRIANVGPQPGLLAYFRIRFERSDGQFEMRMMTENLTRVDGAPDDFFIAPFSTALFRAEYATFGPMNEEDHFNFHLEVRPVRGTGDFTYWGRDDTLDCLRG